FAGYRFKSSLYTLADRQIFERVNKVISVSDAMTRHFRQKYSQWQGPATTYPILPRHIDCPVDNDAVVSGDDPNFIQVVYSGNLQSWQNIDLMLSIRKRTRSHNRKFGILTGERAAIVSRRV